MKKTVSMLAAVCFTAFAAPAFSQGMGDKMDKQDKTGKQEKMEKKAKAKKMDKMQKMEKDDAMAKDKMGK